MSLEDAIMGGIVFKGKKEGPKKDENKVKTKAKKTTCLSFIVIRFKVVPVIFQSSSHPDH